MNAIVTERTHGEVSICPLEHSHQELRNQLFVMQRKGCLETLVLTGEELDNLAIAWLKFSGKN